MNLVHWFEIPVSDMDRAKAFYETVFNIEVTITEMGPSLMGMFPFEEGGMGASGSLVKDDSYAPSHQGSLIYFTVPEINDTLAAIGKAGGKTLTEKFSIGEHGFCGYFEDTEGNKVALHQSAS